MESGSAYRDERWPPRNVLQKQVLALFERLDIVPEDVLAGNLAPFRSPSWKQLRNPHEAFKFGLQL